MTTSTPAPPRRVLVVDDEEDHRLLASRRLRRSDPTVEVLTGDDLAGAVAVVASGTPLDAVVLDLGLPDVPAHTPVAGVRLLAQVPGTPAIVAITGRSDVAPELALSAGADEFLHKPAAAEPDRLHQTVRSAQARHHGRRTPTDCAAWLASGRELGHLGMHLAHDLRTPIAVAMLASETLRDERAPTELRAHLHDLIEDRLSSLLHRFTAIAWSIDQHTPVGEAARTETTLRGVVRRAAARLAPDVADRLDVQVVGELVDTWAEPTVLELALWALLDNAGRHNPDVSVRVVVTLARVDDVVEVTVADDGVGIRPSDRDAVFGIGHHRPGDHAGVGLAAVRAALQSVGAWIVATDGVDGGAGFRLVLPQRSADGGDRRGDVTR